jgi:hypothetical protein
MRAALDMRKAAATKDVAAFFMSLSESILSEVADDCALEGRLANPDTPEPHNKTSAAVTNLENIILLEALVQTIDLLDLSIY